jgi:pyridoxine kinase
MLVSDGKSKYRIRTPELFFENSSSMAGSGDLTAAVFFSRYLEAKDIRDALEKTAASVYGIMEATHRAGSKELLIIAAQDVLANPGTPFKAEKI